VTTKRFLFECFDCYVALFYLAFVQQDIVLLGNELASLYTLNSARRILCESLLPLILRRARAAGAGLAGPAKKVDGGAGAGGALALAAREEGARDTYEQFDDYMEMVMSIYIYIYI
jgi:hypothetical protein